MRNRYKNSNYYPVIAGNIARNYDKLRALCFRQVTGYFDSRSHEDIFQDTVLYVIQDEESLKCTTDEDLIRHFLHRYRMIEFQTIRDARLYTSQRRYNRKTITNTILNDGRYTILNAGAGCVRGNLHVIHCANYA